MPVTKLSVPGPNEQAILARDAATISPSYPRDQPFVMSHGKGTEVYISHRGMREVYTTSSNRSEGNAGDTRWEPREPDTGLEAEFLRRLMVRLGTNDERAKLALAAGPQGQRAQIVKSSDGTQLLQVDEPFDRAWRRIGPAAPMKSVSTCTS